MSTLSLGSAGASTWQALLHVVAAGLRSLTQRKHILFYPIGRYIPFKKTCLQMCQLLLISTWRLSLNPPLSAVFNSEIIKYMDTMQTVSRRERLTSGK